MTLVEKAVAEVADEIHEKWRDAYRAANGDQPRWKVLKEESVAWIAQHKDISPDAIRMNPESGKPEIDIAALPNSKLPPQHSGENTASARSAIDTIIANPEAGMESLAAAVHDQWLIRNGSWAPDSQKKPYADLSEEEKEKDRVVVRAALAASERNGLIAPSGFRSAPPAYKM